MNFILQVVSVQHARAHRPVYPLPGKLVIHHRCQAKAGAGALLLLVQDHRHLVAVHHLVGQRQQGGLVGPVADVDAVGDGIEGAVAALSYQPRGGLGRATLRRGRMGGLRLRAVFRAPRGAVPAQGTSRVKG